MALSKIWTAEKGFNEIRGQLKEVDDVVFAQRFERMNLAQYAVASQFYPLMQSAYMTQKIVMDDQTGIFGAGTWTVATRRLELLVSSAPFVTTDIGKIVVFYIGTDFFLGIIETVVSATTVVLRGSPFPASDDAVDSAIMVASSTTNDYIELSTLDPPMMRTGEQLNLELSSTATKTTEGVSIEDLRTFQPQGPKNLTRIVFCLIGERVELGKGGDLPSYQTLTLHYPRVPIALAADGDYWDIPDGPPMSLALLFLKKLIAPKVDMPAYQAEAATAVQSVLTMYGVKATLQEIKKKVEAFT